MAKIVANMAIHGGELWSIIMANNSQLQWWVLAKLIIDGRS